MIFIVAAFFPTAGIFFLLVGLTFVSYSFVVIFLEVCIPNVFVHRIIVSSYYSLVPFSDILCDILSFFSAYLQSQDIVVLFVFSGLLLISALFNSYFGLKKREGHLCVAAVRHSFLMKECSINSFIKRLSIDSSPISISDSLTWSISMFSLLCEN